jgi:hypothetical protein
MTNDVPPPPDDGGTPPTPPPHGDDATVSTPLRGRNAKTKGSDFNEITLKFRFALKSSNDTVAPEVLHLHWIQLVQEAFSSEIQVFNNKGAVMPKVDTMRWTLAQHSKIFTVHRPSPGFGSPNKDQNRGKRTAPSVYIIHRVRTSLSFKSLKNEHRVVDFLKEHNIYMTEHCWTEDVWHTVQIGFIMGLDPSFYSSNQAHEKMTKAILARAPNAQIPKFAMIFCTPRVRMKSNEVRTKAYAIEVEKSNASTMTNLMKQVCKDTHEFTPFQMRDRHPEAFVRLICQQTHLLSELRTIVIANLGSQVMFYLHDRIAAVPGVRDIMPHPSVGIDGKYRIHVHKDDFKAVRANLMINIPDWYDQYVPPDAQFSTDAYPGTPEVMPIPSDGYSSGEESYYAGSVASALSYAPSDSNDDQQPSYEETMAKFFPSIDKTNKRPTDKIHVKQNTSTGSMYLQAATGVPPPPSSVTDSVSPDEGIMSELRSSRSEVDELRRQLQAVQNEKEQELSALRMEAEKVKHEAELRSAKYQHELEAKVAQQRSEFECQLLEQRHQMEMAAQKNQAALEEKFQTQINRVLQARTPTQEQTSQHAMISPALTTLLENQSQQLTMLTQMMASMASQRELPQSINYSQPTLQRPLPASGLKRTSEAIVDLTSPNASQRSSAHLRQGYDDRTKKQDNKGTPVAKEAPPHGMQLPQTPVSVNTSMSVITPQGLDTPPHHGSFHPPPELHRSPHAWLANDRSPVSNLALRPEYQFGPEDSMTSDVVEAQQSQTPPPPMDDSMLSDNQVIDAMEQHSSTTMQPMVADSIQAATLPDQGSEAAAGSIEENTTGLGHTTPGDQGPSEQEYEL